MEPYLRQLGLPTRLVDSKIELQSDYLLAEEDKPLTVEKCKILKLMKFNVYNSCQAGDDSE